jgi:cation transport protein ChaC
MEKAPSNRRSDNPAEAEMTLEARSMRLSEQHVSLVRFEPDEALQSPASIRRPATTGDHDQTIRHLLGDDPERDEVWVFAYGSLIWKPAFDFVEMRTALVHGWHRAFCLGWDRYFRGSVRNPGLMLALDRGGACHGVAYRLPPGRVVENMRQLLDREMRWLPSPFPPRWVNARAGDAVLRALTFCINRGGGLYVSGLGPERLAEILATAVGERGSMAEYLYATVAGLEEIGIHDPHLWQLQELVALNIERAYHGQVHVPLPFSSGVP